MIEQYLDVRLLGLQSVLINPSNAAPEQEEHCIVEPSCPAYFHQVLWLSHKTPVQRDLPQTMIIFTLNFTSLQKDLLHSLPLSMVVLSAVYAGGSDIMIRLAFIDSKSPKCRPPCTCLTPSCGTSKRGVPVKILQNQD